MVSEQASQTFAATYAMPRPICPAPTTPHLEMPWAAEFAILLENGLLIALIPVLGLDVVASLVQIVAGVETMVIERKDRLPEAELLLVIAESSLATAEYAGFVLQGDKYRDLRLY